MADSVRVDTAALGAAAGQAGDAVHAAIPHADLVRPCAADVVSVAASTRFGAQLALARRYTTLANEVARGYGVRLAAGADAYDQQETVSAAALGAAGAGPAGPVPSRVSDAAGALVDLEMGGVPMAAGEVPAAPRDIARLIETGRGGAGLQAWQAVESSLRTEAAALEDAAEQVGAAITMTESSWDSPSAQAAAARLRTLQSWYHGHAGYLGALAQQACTHMQNFHRATTAIPLYQQVLDAERELETAVRANAMAAGTRREAVVHAQVKVAGLYQASAAGFGSYTVAEAAPGPGPGTPAPPPGAASESPNVQPAKGPSGAPITKPDPSAAAAPLDPVRPGPGVGEDLHSPGPTWPPGVVDPSSGAVVDGVTGAAAAGVPAVVPEIIGGVVGGLGGALGGLAGTGAKALQGMQQAAAPMMSGLGQHPGGGQQGGQPSTESPESPGGEPAGLDAADAGGAQTTPAGDAGALAAPTALEPAPAAATPVSAAPAAAGPATAAGSAPAIGAMGPMMPPPMAGRGTGGGPHSKQLYRDRKLKVSAPPNSEPVKNRREGRDRDKPGG